MNRYAKLYLLWVGLLAGWALVPDQAMAVPAWGRKTGLGCSSCHFGGTSALTRLGRDFQVRGHRFPGEPGQAPWREPMNHVSVAAKLRSASGGAARSAAPDVQSSSVFSGGALPGGFSYFLQYDLYDRGAPAAQPARLADAYLQYNGNPAGERYWWVRAGHLYPYAIYATGAGGRVTLSRPRVITEAMGGGNLHAPLRRSLGISGGYVGGDGIRLEAGITRSQNVEGSSPSSEHPDLFVVAEKDLDLYGSGLGLYGYRGSGGSGRGAALSSPAEAQGSRFWQAGVLGRYARDPVRISGAYFCGMVRDATGAPRRPEGYYLEAAGNLRPDLTGFVRYDSVDKKRGPSARSRGLVLGFSRRLPDRGRVVIEFSPGTGGAAKGPPLLLDVNWLY